MKDSKAITLITLVITIIILIIIAGVSINLAIGDNGLITMAKKAKENIELAKIDEEREINEIYKQMEIEGITTTDEYKAIQRLNEFKKSMAQYIQEAGGIKPEYTASIEEFGESINGIVKNVTKSATATAEDIEEGKTAWVDGQLVIGTKNSQSYYYTTKQYYSPSNTYSCSFDISSECPNYREAKQVIIQRTAGNVFVRGDTPAGYGSCGLATSFDKNTGVINIVCEKTVCFWKGQTYTWAIVLIF